MLNHISYSQGVSNSNVLRGFAFHWSFPHHHPDILYSIRHSLPSITFLSAKGLNTLSISNIQQLQQSTGEMKHAPHDLTYC